jgi:replicative DNA helicase
VITEYFLNNCFSLIFSKTAKIKKDKPLFRDILEIVNFYEKKESLDIPVTVKNKTECLVKVCEMKLKDKTDENIIDSLCASDKYSQLSDFLHTKLSEDTNELILIESVKQVRTRKRLISMFSNYDKLNTFVDAVKNASFDSMDDAVLDYESVIKELYTNMMEGNRSIAIEASSSLDLVKDDYSSVIELIKKKYERKNTTPTGFQIFDSEILTSGGFEPSRLYVFGGGSGSGKSTLLDNFLINAATKANLNLDRDKHKVYIYVTLENTIEESLLRIYQSLVERQLTQVLTDIITKGVDIKAHFKSLLNANNSTVIMKYFAPSSISPIDIMMVVDDAISEYGKDSIKGLYIDYLDLLTSDSQFDQYRLELGHITLSLKTIGVHYNIPVITATQLGRAAYRIQNTGSLNLDQVSESIKKVEHADFVALLALDEQNTSLVHLKTAKNRSGKTNISLDFKVDFSFFKFLDGTKVSNTKNPNVTTDQSLFKFEGMKNVY